MGHTMLNSLTSLKITHQPIRTIKVYSFSDSFVLQFDSRCCFFSLRNIICQNGIIIKMINAVFNSGSSRKKQQIKDHEMIIDGNWVTISRQKIKKVLFCQNTNASISCSNFQEVGDAWDSHANHGSPTIEQKKRKTKVFLTL